MWVYIQSEPCLWTVGFYAPDGTWHTDSDHGIRENAAARVAYLNGGSPPVDEGLASWNTEEMLKEKRLLGVVEPFGAFLPVAYVPDPRD